MRAKIAVSTIELSTKSRIFATATRLYAEFGLDAVPLRDIAREADVNGAAINYHFGSKEQLIREIFRRLLEDVNKLRLEALDECEADAAGKRLDPERVIRALVEPMVRFSSSSDGEGKYLIRLIFQAYGVRRDFVDKSISEQVDHIALRFVDALSSAFPSIGREEIFWRFDFAIGACQHILLERERSHRLRQLSGGLSDTQDVERLIDQLVSSIQGSFGARAPVKRSRRVAGSRFSKTDFRTRPGSQSG
jgi:AcrR family transcriptional regulator